MAAAGTENGGMANRQDRRYAAKLARQAAKRGRTPAERALFGAAAAYSADQPMDLDFTLDGFDKAWLCLEPDLREMLENGYDEFRRTIFADAAWGRMVATSPSGDESEFDLEPILFPVIGTRADVRIFLREPANLEALAASLRSSGMFPEEAAVSILPTVLAADAVDLTRVGPAAVARLTLALADMVQPASSTGKEFLAAAEAQVRNADLPVIGTGADGDLLSCLLLGICLAPAEDWDIPDDEAEARRLAVTATRASWFDTYAADLPFRLDEPVFWHEAGSSLAWHEVVGEIEAEISRRGGGEPVKRIHACLDPEVGNAVLVAQWGDALLGPFRASRALVSTDVDGFAGLAEHYAGELIEHERPEDVFRLVDAAAAGIQWSARPT